MGQAEKWAAILGGAWGLCAAACGARPGAPALTAPNDSARTLGRDGALGLSDVEPRSEDLSSRAGVKHVEKGESTEAIDADASAAERDTPEETPPAEAENEASTPTCIPTRPGCHFASCLRPVGETRKKWECSLFLPRVISFTSSPPDYCSVHWDVEEQIEQAGLIQVVLQAYPLTTPHLAPAENDFAQDLLAEAAANARLLDALARSDESAVIAAQAEVDRKAYQLLAVAKRIDEICDP